MTDSDKTPDRLQVLVLTFTPIKSEPRALKQIRHLSQKHDVTSAGFGPTAVEGIPHIELDPEPPYRGIMKIPMAYGISFVLHLYSLISKYAPRPESARRRLPSRKWDIIIAHDVLTVPLARSLKPRIGVLADLHEYAPRQDEHSRYFRRIVAPYFRWILKRHVTRCAAVTTVGQGIVDEYRDQFGIESTLVVNATPYWDLEPTPTAEPLRLVHSGIPAPHRKLEAMIDGVKRSSANVTLDFYLMPLDDAYMEMLRARAAGDSRIRFCDPVPYDQLVPTLHDYDLGVIVIAPTTFNLAWGLPNKLFDFVQARLGVIVGPSPEMVRYVNSYGFGEITDDFSGESLAKVLDGLTLEKVNNYKRAASACADELSGERQAAIWGEVVDKMANSSNPRSA